MKFLDLELVFAFLCKWTAVTIKQHWALKCCELDWTEKFLHLSFRAFSSGRNQHNQLITYDNQINSSDKAKVTTNNPYNPMWFFLSCCSDDAHAKPWCSCGGSHGKWLPLVGHRPSFLCLPYRFPYWFMWQ